MSYAREYVSNCGVEKRGTPDIPLQAGKYTAFCLRSRSGKAGTLISMISNSVTHLWNYTNTAIADIAENSVPISLVTACDRRAERRRLRIERRYRRIE